MLFDGWRFESRAANKEPADLLWGSTKVALKLYLKELNIPDVCHESCVDVNVNLMFKLNVI